MRKESLKIDSIVDDAQTKSPDSDSDSDASPVKLNNGTNGDTEPGVDPFDALLNGNNTKNVKPPTETKAAKKSIESSAANAATSDSSTNGDAPDEPVASTSAETNGAADENDKSAENGDEEGYEVEEIINHKYKGKRMKKLYLIRWKNYGPEDDTWEEESSLNCPELVEKYLLEHPDERPPEKMPKVKVPKRPKKPPTEAVPRAVPKRAAANVALQENSDDEEDEYEVEKIVNHRVQGGINMYNVKWKGWTNQHNTWEPEHSLNCDDLLEQFKNQPKGKKKKGAKAKKTGAIQIKLGKKKVGGAKKAAKEDAEYEVEKIVDVRTQKGKKEFRIRWKGWSAKDDTWEKLSALDCPEKIKEFEKSRKTTKNTKQKSAGKKGAPKKKGGKKAKVVSDDDEDDDEDESEDYEVEKIVDSKLERGETFYLVKWKGWSSNDNTWEPESSLNCADLLAKYNASAKSTSTTKKRKSNLKTAESPKKVPRKSVTYADDVKETKKKSTKGKRNSEVETVEERDPLAPSDNEESGNDDDNEQEYEVEQIINVRKRKGTKEYLVRWKGCKPSSDTWESEDKVNCPDLIAKFEKQSKPSTSKTDTVKNTRRKGKK